MLSFIEAQHIIKSFAQSYGTEKILLDDALGRVIGEDIYADRDYPPFNRSAMDGYAIQKEDFEKAINSFKIVETVYAGGRTEKIINPGECYKIMTGAAVPLSADAVLRKEDARESEGFVSFLINEIKIFQNIAKKGEDLNKGDLVLNRSTKCNASVIGILSSLGKDEVVVEKLPTIAIITTGNEVVEVNKAVNDVQIRNSNLHVLKALLKNFNIKATYHRHVEDDPEKILSSLNGALDCDLVIMSGGVSAGDADYVPAVLNQAGVEALFHKVAIRPGKPFWCGHKGKTMIFALPGNPLSCLVTFTLFIRYFIECCFGLPQSLVTLPLESERKQRVSLDEFFPVRIKGEPAYFHTISFNGSGDVRLAFEAQALAIHPSGIAQLDRGDIVRGYLL